MKFYYSILFISFFFYSCKQSENNEAVKRNQLADTTTISSKMKIDTARNDNEKSETKNNDDFCEGMENAENMPDSIFESGIELESNRIYVRRQDSTVSLAAQMSLDHRIFGFERPDINSQRLILYSVFTCDVKDNPFHCILGACYDTRDKNSPILKYQGTNDDFAEMIAVSKDGTINKIFIKKKWIEYY